MVENENKQPAGSRRMKILQQSLAKKQAAFDQRLQNHFDDVSQCERTTAQRQAQRTGNIEPLGTPERRFADGGQGN